MNWDEIQRSWGALKGLIQSYWERLSMEDVDRIDGCRTRLAALLQERYGLSDDEANEQINDFERDVRFPGAVK